MMVPGKYANIDCGISIRLFLPDVPSFQTCNTTTHSARLGYWEGDATFLHRLDYDDAVRKSMDSTGQQIPIELESTWNYGTIISGKAFLRFRNDNFKRISFIGTGEPMIRERV